MVDDKSIKNVSSETLVISLLDKKVDFQRILSMIRPVAPVAELADAVDSKSTSLTGVGVRPSPGAPLISKSFHLNQPDFLLEYAKIIRYLSM